ncbi:MAG: hypothetical protein D6820_18000, partial [Lentisphaerae bacterium]
MKTGLYSGAVCILLWGVIMTQSTGKDRTPTLPSARENGISVKLDTGSPYFIYRPGTVLRIRTTREKAVQITLRWGIRHRSNEPVRYSVSRELVLQPSEEIAIPIELASMRWGMRYLDWLITGAEGCGGRGVIPFVLMKPVGNGANDLDRERHNRKGEIVFGIAGGIRIYRELEWKRRFFRAAAMIGCEVYRMDLSWNRLQPAAGKWRLDLLQETVALANAEKLKIQPLVAYGSEWALAPRYRTILSDPEKRKIAWRYPPDLKAWRRFLETLARNFSTRQMQYYEIWNEADLGFWQGTAEEYAQLLKVSYETLKKANPAIIVSTCGFASAFHPRYKEDVVLRAFEDGAFDAVAWHAHGTFEGFRRQVDSYLLPKLREYKLEDRLLFFNESGIGLRFEDEWRFPEVLVKRFVFAWSRGANAYYWYNLTRSHPFYVMLNHNWTPRPSFPAYNELARHLRGRRFIRVLHEGDDYSAYLFGGRGDFSGHHEGDYCVVYWAEKGGQSSTLAVTMGGRVKEAVRWDLMGNATACAMSKGVAILPVSAEPQYLEIEGSETVPGCHLFSSVSSADFTPADGTVTFSLFNPFAFPMKYRVELDSPLVFKAVGGKSDATFSLAPQETKTMELSSKRTPMAGNARQSVRIRIMPVTPGWGETPIIQSYILPAAYPMTTGDGEASRPLFICGGESVVNTNDIDPAFSRYTWKGPGDLSARGWIRPRKTFLEIKVEVTDDIHLNREHYSRAHTADSVEVVLDWPQLSQPFHFVLYRETQTGNSRVHFRGQPLETRKLKLWSRIRLKTIPGDGRMTYVAECDYRDLKLDVERLRRGIRCRIRVNDRDGDEFDGYLAWPAPTGYAWLYLPGTAISAGNGG